MTEAQPGPMLGERAQEATTTPMSKTPSIHSFGGLVSALELAGRDDLAARLTPDAVPATIEEVRQALLAAREPARAQLMRIDMALTTLVDWKDRRPRCSCGAEAIVETKRGPLCLLGFALNGEMHSVD